MRRLWEQSREGERIQTSTRLLFLTLFLSLSSSLKIAVFFQVSRTAAINPRRKPVAEEYFRTKRGNVINPPTDEPLSESSLPPSPLFSFLPLQPPMTSTPKPPSFVPSPPPSNTFPLGLADAHSVSSWPRVGAFEPRFLPPSFWRKPRNDREAQQSVWSPFF